MAALPDPAGAPARVRLRPDRQLRHGAGAHRDRRRLVGWGEAKAAVGSAGSCARSSPASTTSSARRWSGAMPRRINELADLHVQRPARRLRASRGTGVPDPRPPRADGVGDQRRRHGAVGPARPVARRAGRRPVGRAMPRRTWRCTPAAAGPTSTGSAPSSAGYVAAGFGAVKMRVGRDRRHRRASVARVAAAREAPRRGIELMVDAHGTFSVAEAKRFAAGIEPHGVRWFEEPVSADDRAGHGRGAGGDARGDRRRGERVHPLRLPRLDRATAPSTCCSPTWRSAAGRRRAGGSPPSPRPTSSSSPRTAGVRRCRSAPGVSLAFASPAATVDRVLAGGQPAAARSRRRAGHRREWHGWQHRPPRPRRHPAPRVHRRVHRFTRVSHAWPTPTSSTST